MLISRLDVFPTLFTSTVQNDLRDIQPGRVIYIYMCVCVCLWRRGEEEKDNNRHVDLR